MTNKKSTTYKLKKADWFIFIICSLGAVFSLGLYYRDINSFSLKSNENAVATISFKRNTAQRKFIDNDIWEKLNNQSPVYDGDKIRTAADSEVCAEFEDSGSKIQLSENSLVQIYGNKKEKAIEFIGGEIVLTSGTEEKAAATIKTGKKKISAAPNSQVKIVISKAAPKTELKDQAPQEAVVEVLEGEAKIEDIQPAKKKQAEERAESGEEVLKAGQSAIVSVAPLEEKIVPKKEKAKKKDKEKKEKAAAQAEQSVAVVEEAPVVEEKPAEQEVKETAVQNEEDDSAAAVTPAEVEEDLVAEHKDSMAAFAKNVYNQKTGEHNYLYSVSLRKLFGAGKAIPAGAVIELELSGVPDKNLSVFGATFSNGSKVWKDASAYVPISPNSGRGLKAGARFSETVRIELKNDIANTSRGHLSVSYESKNLDQEMNIKDFAITATIYALEASEVVMPLVPTVGGVSRMVQVDSVSLQRVPWNKGASGFELYLPPSKVWGYSKSIAKGSEIKLSVKCRSSLPLEFMNLQLFNAELGNWDFIQENRICDGGVNEINYTGTFVLAKDIENTDSSVFELCFNTEAKKEGRCSLSGLSVTAELIK